MKSILEHFAPYNEEMQKLSRQMSNELRNEYALVVDNPTSGGIAVHLRGNVKKNFGVVDRVAANFKRHGIYVEFGAGRGRGGSKGSTWIAANGVRKSTNPDSLGKMNSGNRPAKPWLFETIDKYHTIIADRAAAHVATIQQQIVLDAVPTTRVKR